MLTRRMGAYPFFLVWDGVCGWWGGAFDPRFGTFVEVFGALAT